MESNSFVHHVKRNPVFWIILGLIGVTYWQTFVWMYDRWNAPETYYGHGFLIFPMSLFWLWNKRQSWSIETQPAHRLGLVIIAGSLLVQVMAVLTGIHFVSGFSLLPLLCGLVFYFGGWPWVKRLLFPILFLAFMIPAPLILIANINLELKLFSTRVALKAVQLLGIVAIQQGSMLVFENGIMIVGDICSGVRSTIALFAFSSYYAFWGQARWIHRMILLAISIPVAVFANIVRIITVCLIAQVIGPEKTEGFIHDATGILVFVVAFVVLLSVDKIIGGFFALGQTKNGSGESNDS